MSRHVFDPVSAVLGTFAVVASLLVAIGVAVDLDIDMAWLITVAAILIGLAIIPWTGRLGFDSQSSSFSSVDLPENRPPTGAASPQLGGQQASPEEAADADGDRQ